MDHYDAERFQRDTANHRMTVLHDDGLYRHLRFQTPSPGFYGFDLITWPDRLAFSGTMATFVFARHEDMFEFFRGGKGSIHPGYWAEKVQDGRERASAYSMDRFLAEVADVVKDAEEGFPGLGGAVSKALSDEYNHEYQEGAQEFLRDFTYRTDVGHATVSKAEAAWSAAIGKTSSDERNALWKAYQQVLREHTFEFYDAGEWDLHDWSWEFLWACHAIVWGIAQYDAAKAAVPEAVTV